MQEMTRRDFLKGAAMAGGAVMLGGLHGLGRVQAAGADAKYRNTTRCLTACAIFICIWHRTLKSAARTNTLLRVMRRRPGTVR